MFCELAFLFYFVSFDIRDILFNSQSASSSSRNTFDTFLQIITPCWKQPHTQPLNLYRFPPGRYKVTAVAAKPKPTSNAPMEEIKEDNNNWFVLWFLGFTIFKLVCTAFFLP